MRRPAAVRWRPVPPDGIAATAGFLLGPDAGYITGQTMRVDGGLTL